jgi:hypothetical protein
MRQPVAAPGYGWVTFAAVMLGLVGVFNVIDGIVAVAKDDYVLDDLLFSDLTAWGWFFIIWGAIQIAASIALLSGALWATAVGIATAFLNAIAQLSWLRHYPVWSIIIIAIDVLVIYALAVYGGRREVVAEVGDY